MEGLDYPTDDIQVVCPATLESRTWSMMEERFRQNVPGQRTAVAGL